MNCLDALTSAGLPGMLLLLAVCVGALVLAIRRSPPPLTAALIGMLVAMQFMSFTVTTAFTFTCCLLLIAATQEGRLVKLQAAGMADAGHRWSAFALSAWGVTLAIADHELQASRASLPRRRPRSPAPLRSCSTVASIRIFGRSLFLARTR